jgi:homoserine kinase type II
LINKTAQGELTKAVHWRTVDLPRQRRLGDVHHDHVLFTGDKVTGVIDFGAADYDSPAGDAARLLGSLVGDDRDMWRQGLTEYCEVHPLSDVEVAAVEFFDSSGTVVSAANWILWLWGGAENRLQLSDYSRPLARLARLRERLRALAARGQ